jgi:TPR repeat protein
MIGKASAGLCLATAALALGACAAPGTYAGISLAAGIADPQLQALARRAQAGDKRAQLDLGIRYEEGLGVATDLGRAEKLYAIAAADAHRQTWRYQKSALGSQAFFAPSSDEISQRGLPEAKTRLAALNRRRAHHGR